ncbi:MAG: arylsulfatase [Bacteroidales bacterium]|nr:arylsulfatase [Bacteroidales bacterium]
MHNRLKILSTGLTGAAVTAAATAGITACSNNHEQHLPSSEDRPNILLILSDDVGYGDIHCYGSSMVPTPHLDGLASESLRFLNMHASASTSTPSRYSLLTGCYAWRRNDTGIARGDAASIIHDSQYTLADMFHDAGYATAAVGKWHLGLGTQTGGQDWNSRINPNPCDLGFDYSYIMAATADRTPCVWVENGLVKDLDPADPLLVSYVENFPGEPTGKDNPEMLRMGLTEGHDQTIVNGISRIGYMKGAHKARWRDEDIPDSIVRHSISFMEDCVSEGKPFFLYMATNDIHVPRVPNARFAGKSGLGPRGDVILSLDWTVGEVLDALKRLGIEDDTIVIFTSDNGPVIDDGYADQAVELLGDHRPSGIYRGGKYSIYDAGTRVPFMLRWPSKVKPSEPEGLMCQIDMIGSFASWLGVDIPEGAASDSEDMMSQLLGRKARGRDELVLQNRESNLAIISGDWKFIPSGKGPAWNKGTATDLGNRPYDQLFRLSDDPREEHNVAESFPEVCNKLRERVDVISADRVR